MTGKGNGKKSLTRQLPNQRCVKCNGTTGIAYHFPNTIFCYSCDAVYDLLTGEYKRTDPSVLMREVACYG